MMPYEDFRMIIRSFLAAFPHATLWHKHTTDCCLLVGGVAPLAIDFQRYERSFNQSAVVKHLGRSNVREVYDMLDSFCLGPEAMARIAGQGPLHTDRRPLIEYHNFRVRMSDRFRSLAALRENREQILPYVVNVPSDRRQEIEARLDRWFRASQVLLKAQLLDDSGADPAHTAAAYEKAIELNPDDMNARFLWRRWSASIQMRLAQRAFAAGRTRQCVDHLRRAVRTSPESRYGREAKYRLDLLGKGAPPSPE